MTYRHVTDFQKNLTAERWHPPCGALVWKYYYSVNTVVTSCKIYIYYYIINYGKLLETVTVQISIIAAGTVNFEDSDTFVQDHVILLPVKTTIYEEDVICAFECVSI